MRMNPTVMSLEKLDAMIRSEQTWHESVIRAETSRYEAALRAEKSRHERKTQEIEMAITTIKNLPRGEQ